MLEDAFHTAMEMEIPIESNTFIEGNVMETGDHAVKWGVIYQINNVEKILSIRRDFREVILEKSKAHGIALATPFTRKTVWLSACKSCF